MNIAGLRTLTLEDVRERLERMNALAVNPTDDELNEREAIHRALDARLKPHGFVVIYNYMLGCYSVRVVPQ